MYDIVFIEGNKKYLTKDRHDKIKKDILDLFPNLNTYSIESDNIDTNHIPKSKVYIGFSQGTRYFKKMEEKNSKSLKISLGGITGRDIIYFKNVDDNARKGDYSYKSLNSHFTITESTKKSILKVVSKYIKSYKESRC